MDSTHLTQTTVEFRGRKDAVMTRHQTYSFADPSSRVQQNQFSKRMAAQQMQSSVPFGQNSKTSKAMESERLKSFNKTQFTWKQPKYFGN